ncbi:MAG TPA: hypothetical protein VGN90_16400 [Pyrinomonadaceae bacterium]|nr:hypothetical protein [Pyrinomonadaceae bacterium]
MDTGNKRWQSRTKHDLIIEVWEALDCESVGTRELEQIQAALRERFGEGALSSPASIARTVADEGAVLRHPEVFACDLNWRRHRLENRVLKDGLDFTNLSSAFESVVKIEEKRILLGGMGEEAKGGTGEKGKGERGRQDEGVKLRELRELVSAEREESLRRARSKILDEDQRRQAKEISEWLSVWLQSPELFSDWLDLRRRSPEFRKRFSEA